MKPDTKKKKMFACEARKLRRFELWSSRTFSAADGEFPAKLEAICLIHICLRFLSFMAAVNNGAEHAVLCLAKRRVIRLKSNPRCRVQYK